MSAMRKMMLVTRIRMFRKVNHLRMVWALEQEILIISQTDSVTATKHSLLSELEVPFENKLKSGEAVLSERK